MKIQVLRQATRAVESVSFEDRPTRNGRDLSERLREIIIENLKIANAGIVTERMRPSGSEGGVKHDLVVRVGSSEHVVAIADKVASACAAAGMRTPQVVPWASRDLLSLDFGSLVLTIENRNAPLRSAPLGDSVLAKAYVLQEAQRIFADAEKASHWLQRPSRALGGRAPLAMLDTAAGVREVTEELGRIDHGIFS